MKNRLLPVLHWRVGPKAMSCLKQTKACFSSVVRETLNNRLTPVLHRRVRQKKDWQSQILFLKNQVVVKNEPVAHFCFELRN